MASNSHPIALDAKLADSLENQYNVGPEPDLFGLEIELEGRHVVSGSMSIASWWTIHSDGSLRVTKPGAEACEYVFRRPLNMEDTKLALASLLGYLTNTVGVEVFDSYRTSIHVHVNCLNETIRTIVNYITLAIIFDELFVSQNGETRIGNNFCLRSRDAEGQIADLCQTVSKFGSLFNLSKNDRYSSVNASSLLKFGTIEFRSLECTTDYHRIVHWIKTLQALKVSARKYENPREIISKFSRHGPLGFMVSSLGEQYAKYAGVPGAHNMLQNGMRLAQDFAFCSDWRQPKPGEKPVRTKRMSDKAWANQVLADYAQGVNPAQQVNQVQNLAIGQIPHWYNQIHGQIVAAAPPPPPAPQILPNSDWQEIEVDDEDIFIDASDIDQDDDLI